MEGILRDNVLDNDYSDLSRLPQDVANAYRAGIRGPEVSSILSKVDEVRAEALKMLNRSQSNERRMADELRALRSWHDISSAPQDIPVLIYAEAAHGLPAFQAVAQWHPDGGWCVCELREATHWRPLPTPPDDE